MLLSLLCSAAPAVVQGQGRAPAPADVTFITGMIAHHAQAVEMVALVPARTTRRELLLIAERIDVSQRDEIVWMRQWLADHGSASTEDHGAHDHAGMGHASMPGMLSPDALASMARASGADFERRFLEGMIRHHEGALTMVATLLGSQDAAQRSEIFAFASDVDADQRAEIARMRRVLATLTRR
jgi:uncharacterized protein (DUF305 family)